MHQPVTLAVRVAFEGGRAQATAEGPRGRVHHLVTQQLPRALEGLPAGGAAEPPGPRQPLPALRAGAEQAWPPLLGALLRRNVGHQARGRVRPVLVDELHQGPRLRLGSSGRLGEVERGHSPQVSRIPPPRPIPPLTRRDRGLELQLSHLQNGQITRPPSWSGYNADQMG